MQGAANYADRCATGEMEKKIGEKKMMQEIWAGCRRCGPIFVFPKIFLSTARRPATAGTSTQTADAALIDL
jgi:hypothetical protein